MAAQKILIILRHGKAEPARGGQEDHERPLAGRGLREAALIGAYMARHRLTPQKILCSTAVRTRETCAEVRKAHGHLPEADVEDAVYMAADKQLLQLIAKTSDGMRSLMLIGHNPGLHQLAFSLARDGDRQHLRQLATSFPTCALAVIRLDVEAWKEIRPQRGTLETFVVPAEIKPDSL